MPRDACSTRPMHSHNTMSLSQASSRGLSSGGGCQSMFSLCAKFLCMAKNHTQRHQGQPLKARGNTHTQQQVQVLQLPISPLIVCTARAYLKSQLERAVGWHRATNPGVPIDSATPRYAGGKQHEALPFWAERALVLNGRPPSFLS